MTIVSFLFNNKRLLTITLFKLNYLRNGTVRYRYILVQRYRETIVEIIKECAVEKYNTSNKKSQRTTALEDESTIADLTFPQKAYTAKP